jgi:hypothetical protein
MDGTENCSEVDRAYIRPYSVAWARSGAVIRKTLSQGADRMSARTKKGPFPLQTSGNGPICGGRYWVRTSDLFGVNEARYHCANRPDAFEC